MLFRSSPNPLDNTWVHPENYALASEILPVIRSGADLTKDLRKSLKETYAAGDTTIDDIVIELRKPNRDPREEYPKPVLQQGFIRFEDLKEGMMVTGKVKNVVDFGAFVDIGIKESALIHVSELSDRFVEDPMEVLKVGDVKQFRIISLDVLRKRIGLSLKTERREGTPRGSAGNAHAGSTPGSGTQTEGVRGAPQGNRGIPATGQGSRNAPPARQDTRSSGGYRADRPAQSTEDEGTSYNPFADLLKNRKK